MAQKNIDPFEAGHFYHVFNKTINKEKFFYADKNYRFFLQRFKKYLSGFLDTFSYCLILNHFHLLVRINENLKTVESLDQKITEQFRKFFISYVQAINKQENRSGSLLQKKFKRTRIKDNSHLMWVIYYIHRNPVHHKLSKDLSTYKWSSYQALAGSKKTALKREEVFNYFGGQSEFIKFHEENLKIDKKLDYFKIEELETIETH